MFYFLVLTGSALILFGMYSRKRRQAAGNDPVPQALMQKVQEDPSGTADFDALSIRMEQIEKLVFQSLMVNAGRKADIRNESGGIDEETEETASGPESEENPAEEAHSTRTGCPAFEGAGLAAQAGPSQNEGRPEMTVLAFAGTKPEVAAQKKMPDNIRAIVDYERQGLSVQEIAKVTRMKKGEVLLLKNLSKHYFK